MEANLPPVKNAPLVIILTAVLWDPKQGNQLSCLCLAPWPPETVQ